MSDSITLPAEERIRQMKAALEVQFLEDWKVTEEQKIESDEDLLKFIIY